MLIINTPSHVLSVIIIAIFIFCSDHLLELFRWAECGKRQTFEGCDLTDMAARPAHFSDGATNDRTRSEQIKPKAVELVCSPPSEWLCVRVRACVCWLYAHM